jgi:hypothetical protein
MLFLEVLLTHMLAVSVRLKITQKADPEFIFRSRVYLISQTVITQISRVITQISMAISDAKVILARDGISRHEVPEISVSK